MTATTNGAAPEESAAAPDGDLAAQPIEDQGSDPDLLAAVTLAFDLVDHGIPVVVCRPNSQWSPGANCADVIPPRGWSTITAEECRARLTEFRPGVDTLALVGGHGVDAVDVDPKAGGSVANLPPFRFYGVHSTPSGGEHYLVPSTGIAKISPLTTSAGHVGDYIGGTAEGASRALLYLPGSARPKYPGKTYRVQQRVDLDLLLNEEPDDELIAALEGAGGRRTGNPGSPAATLTAVDAFLVAHDRPLEPECTFGRKIVREELAKAEGTVPGHPTAGRHAWCQRTLVRLVELMRSGCATTADLEAVRAKLEEIKPEGDDFDEMLAWALANADGEVTCLVHRPSAEALDMRTAVRDLLGEKAGSADTAGSAATLPDAATASASSSADTAVSATTPSDPFAEPAIELTPSTCPRPFPVDALPGWVADMVDAVAMATQTDAGMAGTVVLGALAAAAGGHVRVAVRAGWTEPVNLFTATAAEPGSRKSAVFQAITRPLQEAERELIIERGPVRCEAQVQRDVAQAAAEKAKKTAATAGTHETLSEAQSASAHAQSIQVPPEPRLLADDATPEAITSLLAERGGRIAVISAEGGLFGILAGRYSKVPNLDSVLKGHAGDLIRVDRKGRPPELIDAPALSLVLTVQPFTLQENGKVGEFTGRGLLARVLYSLPPSLVGRRRVGAAEVPPPVAATYGDTLRQLAKALHGWQEPQTLILSPEAAALHLEAERRLEPRLGPGGDLRPVVEWASKLMGAIARLAGLLHIAEHGAELAVRRPIGVDTMSAALSLGAYFTAHARVAFDLMGADPALARGQDVLDYVHGRRLAEVSVRDLFTALSRSRFPKTEDVMSALEVLVAHGWAARQPEPAASGPGRRPSPRFRFRPR